MITNDSIVTNSGSKVSSNTIFLIVLFVLSLIVSIFVSNPLDERYANIYLLPLFTGVFFLFQIYRRKNIFNNVINVLVNSLLFIRNCVAILLLQLADYQSLFPAGDSKEINKTILLMILESFFIVLVISLYKSKINNNIENKSISNIFKMIIWILTLFSLTMFIIIPEVKLSYTTIFSGYFPDALVFPSSGINRSLFMIFKEVFPMTQLLLPLILINTVKTKFGETNLSLLISFIITMTPLLIISPSSAYSLVLFITFLLTLLKLYPTKNKVLVKWITVLGILAVFFFVFIKFTSNSTNNNMLRTSDFIQSYFPGITSIASSYLINKDWVNWSLFFNEIITYVPLRPIFFKEWDSSFRSIHLFQIAIKNPYQIMSNLSVAYLYIGGLSVFLSGILVRIANYFYNRKSENIVIYGINLLIAIYFAISPIMLNIVTVGAKFSEMFIYLLLLGWISNIHWGKK